MFQIIVQTILVTHYSRLSTITPSSLRTSAFLVTVAIVHRLKRETTGLGIKRQDRLPYKTHRVLNTKYLTIIGIPGYF